MSQNKRFRVREGMFPDSGEHSDMDLAPLSETALRLAARIVPAHPSGEGAATASFLLFLEDLFSHERNKESARLVAFLERCSQTEENTWEADPWFREWAEVVNEYYWTSPEGCRAVGFADNRTVG